MKVAVLGAGPAGSMAAARLAAEGVETVLIDEKPAWEKPCGGGLTWKAWSRYPFLTGGPVRKQVSVSRLSIPGSRTATLQLNRPIFIYSRRDLNGLLLDRAIAAGAHFEQTRITAADYTGSNWRLKTASGTIEADRCVVATGARNPLRSLGTEFGTTDTACALGYFVPGERDEIDVQFFPDLEGYIWVFPRAGHLSVGICGAGATSAAMREMLHRYMDEHGISRAGATFYAHALPCLEAASFRKNRVAGEGWLAAGDAAGLVDPITGEGIYYAMRSGEMAADTLISAGLQPAAEAYSRELHAEILEELQFAAQISNHFFHGKYLLGSTIRRMIQFTRLSPKFREVMQDLFAGTQPYLGLSERLFRNLSRTLFEIAVNTPAQAFGQQD